MSQTNGDPRNPLDADRIGTDNTGRSDLDAAVARSRTIGRDGSMGDTSEYPGLGDIFAETGEPTRVEPSHEDFGPVTRPDAPGRDARVDAPHASGAGDAAEPASTSQTPPREPVRTPPATGREPAAPQPEAAAQEPTDAPGATGAPGDESVWARPNSADDAARAAATGHVAVDQAPSANAEPAANQAAAANAEPASNQAATASWMPPAGAGTPDANGAPPTNQVWAADEAVANVQEPAADEPQVGPEPGPGATPAIPPVVSPVVGPQPAPGADGANDAAPVGAAPVDAAPGDTAVIEPVDAVGPQQAAEPVVDTTANIDDDPFWGEVDGNVELHAATDVPVGDEHDAEDAAGERAATQGDVEERSPGETAPAATMSDGGDSGAHDASRDAAVLAAAAAATAGGTAGATRTIEVDRTTGTGTGATRIGDNNGDESFGPLRLSDDDATPGIPVKPRARSNRGFAFAMSLLGTVVFGALFLAAFAVLRAIYTDNTDIVASMLEFAPTAAFYVPVILVGVFFVLWSIISNRAGQLSYALASTIAAAIAYFGYHLGVTTQLTFNTGGLTIVDPFNTVMDQAHLPAGLVAALLAALSVMWFGTLIAMRGRRLQTRYRTALRRYEDDVAAGEPATRATANDGSDR